MWSLIVAFITPPVLAIIQQPTWTQPVRAGVMFVFAIILGLGTAYFTDSFNGEDIVTSVLIVLVAAISAYKGFWQPTGIAPKIETATSPSGNADA
jgi:hypothetical protein